MRQRTLVTGEAIVFPHSVTSVVTEQPLALGREPQIAQDILVDVDSHSPQAAHTLEIVGLAVIEVYHVHRRHPYIAVAIAIDGITAPPVKRAVVAFAGVVVTHQVGLDVVDTHTGCVSAYPQVVAVEAQRMHVVVKRHGSGRGQRNVTVASRRRSVVTQSAVVRRYPHIAHAVLAKSRYDVTAHRVDKSRVTMSVELLEVGCQIIDTAVEGAYPHSILSVTQYGIDKLVRQRPSVELVILI